MTQAIPVIDLSGWRVGQADPPGEVAGQIDHALRHVGFMVLTGHGVPADVIGQAFAAAKAFHALPEAEKRAVALNRNNNGYMQFRATTIRTSTVAKNETADLNEAFFYRTPLPDDHPDVLAGRKYRGLNQWPARPGGFRAAAEQYADAMGELAGRLRRALALTLGLDGGWFDDKFTAPQWVVRMSHYLPAPAGESVFGIAPHTDSGFFTLLPMSDVPGLEVKLAADWVAPPFIPGGIVFNSGDMLHRWSNRALPSTPHRALPPKAGDRYAIPYFYGPDWDAEIHAVPTCLAEGAEPEWPPTTYAEYMDWWYTTNYGA